MLLRCLFAGAGHHENEITGVQINLTIRVNGGDTTAVDQRFRFVLKTVRRMFTGDFDELITLRVAAKTHPEDDKQVSGLLTGVAAALIAGPVVSATENETGKPRILEEIIVTAQRREEGALVLFPGSHLKARHPTTAENWMADGRSLLEMMDPDMKPEDLEGLDWQLPSGGVTMEIEPGDCVVWHGNTWHGSWRRDASGTRINLAVYFCRDFMTTQELRGDTRYPEVFERYADEPWFAQLLGENRYNGWREEGPNYGRKAPSRNKATNKS